MLLQTDMDTLKFIPPYFILFDCFYGCKLQWSFSSIRLAILLAPERKRFLSFSQFLPLALPLNKHENRITTEKGTFFDHNFSLVKKYIYIFWLFYSPQLELISLTINTRAVVTTVCGPKPGDGCGWCSRDWRQSP